MICQRGFADEGADDFPAFNFERQPDLGEMLSVPVGCHYGASSARHAYRS